MVYRDLLLTALTYPDATPDAALRSGVALARRCGADLTVLTIQLDAPDLRNPFANAVLDLDRIAAMERERSHEAARMEATCARIAAEEAGVTVRTTSLTARLYEEAEPIARAARCHDLSLVPLGATVLVSRSVAETVLFESGRPMIVYPEDQEIAPGDGFGVIAVAWDGSQRAARAVGDALPLIKRAKSVRIYTAVGEKAQATRGLTNSLVRHLAAHGVKATADEREAQGAPIGRRLADYVAETKADLLVMGGYGRTRIREYVLGGATEAMLHAPPCPVLMSH